jgi:hypothetical protein
VPFVRFSRDSRGYEHTYLVHESGARGRPSRVRVLYWFRTPPGIKVGRQPFDEEARQQIESHNPGVAFDWNAIVSTSMPPVPEVEHWRERRRAERAAKVARHAEEAEEEAEKRESSSEASDRVALTIAQPTPVEEPRLEPAMVSSDLQAAADLVGGPAGSTQGEKGRAGEESRKRRRRRGGRNRHRPGEPVTTDGSQRRSSEGAEPEQFAGPPELHRDTSEE